MSSDTRQSRPRYWCHICNAEVPIYMAPDPTCQQCNEQFIEEVSCKIHHTNTVLIISHFLASLRR